MPRQLLKLSMQQSQSLLLKLGIQGLRICTATTVLERTGSNSVLLNMTVVPIPGGCAKAVFFFEAQKFQYVDVFLACELRGDVELF